MKIIKQDSTIEIDYEGYTEDKLFDTSKEDIAKKHKIYNPQREYIPLKTTLGKGQLIKGFEQALIGMKQGEEKEIKIKPEDAYGQYNKNQIQEIDKSIFGEKVPKKGEIVLMKINQQPVQAKVLEVKDKIKLDFNPPLAGKTLTFKLKVISIE